MGFYKQFDYFDPLKGTPPLWLFPEAASIAPRARALLQGRSRDDIHRLAEDASAILESFFDMEKSETLQMIRGQERYDLLELDKDGICIGISEAAHQEFDIRTSENMREIEALAEGFETFFDAAAIEVPNAKQYEYFAAMALWFIGDFIMTQECEYDFQQNDFVPRTNKNYDTADIARMGRMLIDAMEAVCYGERLREVERTQKKYEERMQEIQATHRPITDKDIEQIRAELLNQIQDEARAQRKEQSQENNRLRHQENNDVKKLVLDAWEKDPSKFASAEKAADHFAEMLEVNGTPRSHRTVVDWIRAHARAKGIRFR